MDSHLVTRLQSAGQNVFKEKISSIFSKLATTTRHIISPLIQPVLDKMATATLKNGTFYLLLASLIISLGLPGTTQAKTIKYTFKIAYMSGYPDGVLSKSILAINNQYPGPMIEAEVGDNLEITVINNIPGQNTSLHWHGIFQKGTPFEDGPGGITQCELKSGKTQVYRFPVLQSGTYWYHAHVRSQYTEGLWGAMIIREKEDVYQHLYQDEIIITLNEWYHTNASANEKYLLSPSSHGAPPYPSSVLMNGLGRYPCIPFAEEQNLPCFKDKQLRPVYQLTPGKTYRLRVINSSGWTAFNFTVDGHTLRTIGVDGVTTELSEPHQAIHIAAGQRYSFLLEIPSSGQPSSRFLIRADARVEFLFTLKHNINPYPEALIQEATGVIVYTDSPATTLQTVEPFDYTQSYIEPDAEQWSNLNFLDEMTLVPYDGLRPPPNYDVNVELNILFSVGADGIRRGAFNLKPSEVPLGIPELAMFVKNLTIPETIMPVYVKYGDIVQVVVNNPELGTHPIHLHGHHFWVMGKGKNHAGNYTEGKDVLQYTGHRRDTFMVREKSWIVIRFRADNVGVWYLHCHIDWHMLTGMMMSFVEAPELAHTLTIPDEARRVCADHGIII